jgi:tight adherence protein B
METGTMILAVGAGLGVMALVAGLALMLRAGPSRMEDRLSQLTTATVGGGDRQAKQASVLAQPLDAVPNFLDTLFERFGKFDMLFEQADVSMTVTKLVVVSGVLACGGLVAAHFSRLNVALWPVCGLFAAALPLLWILWRRKRRLKAFAVQLPDAMEMLARGLRSGQSIGAGMNMVASEMPQPISKEFGRVFEEQNLGIPIEQSLNDLTERVPNLDLKFFATAVILQRQTGGDLAEILDKIGELVRDRFRIWGQIQALTGEGRLSGIVLMALPLALFLAVYYLNPDYVMVLFTDPMGKKMLIGAIIMQVLGAVCIRKIVNIKV